MAFGQIVGVVLTWWQVIGVIRWELRPDDVGQPMGKFATMDLLVRQNRGKKESRVRQNVHNPESLIRRFSKPRDSKSICL